MSYKLTPTDTVNAVVHESSEGETKFSEHVRDVLKRAFICSGERNRLMLLGLENQSTVDPWMVMRSLE